MKRNIASEGLYPFLLSLTAIVLLNIFIGSVVAGPVGTPYPTNEPTPNPTSNPSPNPTLTPDPKDTQIPSPTPPPCGDNYDQNYHCVNCMTCPNGQQICAFWQDNNGNWHSGPDCYGHSYH